jgi:putative acetyltransferase
VGRKARLIVKNWKSPASGQDAGLFSVYRLAHQCGYRRGAAGMGQHSVIHTPKSSDYPELVRIWEASVRATHDFLPDSYIVLLKDLVLTRYLDAVMLICTKDARQRITGFAGVAAGKVEMLFIDPQYRGQGLGRQLLRYAVECMNADELEVNEQNPQALGFYLKQGFEVIGRTEHDGLGKPYPLLRMRLRQLPSQARQG